MQLDTRMLKPTLTFHNFRSAEHFGEFNISRLANIQ